LTRSQFYALIEIAKFKKKKERRGRKVEFTAVIAAVAIVAIAGVVLALVYQHRRVPQDDVNLVGQILGDPAVNFRRVVKKLTSTCPLEARLEVRGSAGPGWSPPHGGKTFLVHEVV